MVAGARESALSEFIAESSELVQRFASGLEGIERGRADAETIHALYRDVHTLKGAALLFGFQQLGSLAHAVESSLEPFRRCGETPDRKVIDAWFACLDAIEAHLEAIRADGQERERAQPALVAALVDATCAFFDANPRLVRDTPGVGEDLALLRKEASPPRLGSEASPPRQQAEAVPAPVSLTPLATPPAPHAAPEPAPSGEHGDDSAASGTIRVQVGVLDRLMNLVGELVLVRNQVLQYANKHDELEFINLTQRMNLVTSDLQGEVMKTRMQPIGSVLSKFYRVVRDLSRDLAKQIDLRLEGTETELDKTLVESIKDPLMHIIRNACDHGIETPAERRAAGKPEKGGILIRAFHESGQVVLEIADDGRGMDHRRISARAVEKRIITQEKASRLTEREAIALIFEPGFSTAEKVTSVSGRGVGMDVVKTNIERIGGTVELSTEPGRGSTFRLKIPLTLAIVPALVVRAGSEKFAIPQIKLVELVRNGESAGGGGIELLHGRPVFRLRGRVLPLIDLGAYIGGAARAGWDGANIVVVNSDGFYFGIVVDDILDTADIVVKPLAPFLKPVEIYSGATILGDGAIALILDVAGLSRKSGIAAQPREAAEERVETRAAASRAQDSQDFLTFRLSAEGYFAVPLCLVSRLEEIRPEDVEHSGGQRVIRYRGEILPLVPLSRRLGFEAAPPPRGSEKIPVIVVRKFGRSFGIEVSEILDVHSIQGEIDHGVRDREGIMGNVVSDDAVIAVVDVLSVLDRVARELHISDDAEGGASKAARAGRRVLFAEDSAFFRKQVSRILQDAGYEVVQFPDGKAALEALKASGPDAFHAVVSDIEMPNLDGYGLARAIRSAGAHSALPLVAVTTKFSQADIVAGMRAGFDVYLEKLNGDKLVTELDRLIRRGGDSHVRA